MSVGITCIMYFVIVLFVAINSVQFSSVQSQMSQEDNHYSQSQYRNNVELHAFSAMHFYNRFLTTAFSTIMDTIQFTKICSLWVFNHIFNYASNYLHFTFIFDFIIFRFFIMKFINFKRMIKFEKLELHIMVIVAIVSKVV